MVLGARSRGLSPVTGSSEKTSTAAPARRPSCRAFASASSSTSPPRATLTSTAPCFIMPSRSPFNIPSVSGVSGACRVTTSDCASSSSKPTGDTPSSPALSGESGLIS